MVVALNACIKEPFNGMCIVILLQSLHRTPCFTYIGSLHLVWSPFSLNTENVHILGIPEMVVKGIVKRKTNLCHFKHAHMGNLTFKRSLNTSFEDLSRAVQRSRFFNGTPSSINALTISLLKDLQELCREDSPKISWNLTSAPYFRKSFTTSAAVEQYFEMQRRATLYFVCPMYARVKNLSVNARTVFYHEFLDKLQTPCILFRES